MLKPKTDLDPSDVSGYVTSMNSAMSGITAFAGGGQANATLLTSAFNRLGTVATGADSVKLPPARAGASLVITNAGASSANVFPQTGQSINALSADAAFAMAAGVTAMFVCTGDGVWNTIS